MNHPSLTGLAVLKLLIAATYTSFTTTIVDDEGIEQTGDLIAGPRSNKLIVAFRMVENEKA